MKSTSRRLLNPTAGINCDIVKIPFNAWAIFSRWITINRAWTEARELFVVFYGGVFSGLSISSESAACRRRSHQRSTRELSSRTGNSERALVEGPFEALGGFFFNIPWGFRIFQSSLEQVPFFIYISHSEVAGISLLLPFSFISWFRENLVLARRIGCYLNGLLIS